MSIQEIAGDFSFCREYTKRHARSFYFASHVLPRGKRDAAYALYTVCRYADNIIDGAQDVASAAGNLTELREELEVVYGARPGREPRLAAFSEVVTRYGIPKEHFLDLLRGVEMDLRKSRYSTFEELQEYCYRVASVVGLAMTRIFGAEREEAERHAVALGIAMQLTNILRDVREDALLGRVYLPAEELDRFGLSAEEISRGVCDDRFRRFMAFQVSRAHTYYLEADKGIALLTNDGSRLCVLLMSRIYRGILSKIEERGYDVFAGRAHVTFRGKLRIAARAWRELRPHRSIARDTLLPSTDRADFGTRRA